MPYSDQQIDDIRERSDLVTVIGRRVQLRKVGKDYTGLCPFHGERTPSFYVVPNKHMWHCFGCGESGDVYKFFMKLDGMSFVDAVKHVATEGGFILTEEKFDPEEAKRKQHLDELATLLDRAVRFYEQKLAHETGRPAREHLQKRGITEEFIRRFHLGFAGAGFDDLSRALLKAGVSVDLAVESGLCIPSRRGDAPFDRFHGRLIVPIRIPRPPDGRTVALGGRFLEGVTDSGSRSDRKPAKYINCPETPLYHKGHVLFGLDQARDAIRKEERAVVVEGYFDVIGVHQAGLPLAVATCGTSLTPNHLDLLMRTGAKEIVFLFDGDEAGVRAAARAAEMCARTQVPARVGSLPTGVDPDEYARKEGLDALKALLIRARPAVEMLIDHALNAVGPNPTVEERVRAVQAVRSIVMASPEGLSRELYVGQIARKLGVTDAVVKAALAEPPRNQRQRLARPAADARPARGPRDPVGPRRDSPPERVPVPSDADAPPPADVPLPPATPEVTRSPAIAAARARRTFPFEEALTVGLLKYPVLAAVVAKEGVLADFGNPVLQALAAHVIHLQQENQLPDGARLLEEVEDADLKRRLQRALADGDSSLEQTAVHVERVLVRLQQELQLTRARAQYRQAQESGLTIEDPDTRARLTDDSARRRDLNRRKNELKRRPG
jgi:DNA primase